MIGTLLLAYNYAGGSFGTGTLTLYEVADRQQLVADLFELQDLHSTDPELDEDRFKLVDAVVANIKLLRMADFDGTDQEVVAGLKEILAKVSDITLFFAGESFDTVADDGMLISVGKDDIKAFLEAVLAAEEAVPGSGFETVVEFEVQGDVLQDANMHI